MRSFLKKHSEFVGHVAVMMSGKAIAAIIALVAIPIVARLFVPSDFGIAAIFASVVGIISSVGSLRYATAIILPKEEPEATNLMAFSYRVTLLVFLVMLVLIGLFDATELNWTGLELLDDWKWLLPFGVLLVTAVDIQDNWLTRQKKFRTMSTSLVVQNASTSGSRIAIGALFGSSVYGLVAGYFLGLFCRLAVLGSAVRDGMRTTFSHMSWPAMKEIAHRYSDFPKYNAPAGLVFAMGQNLPVLFFGVMFSPGAAGLLAMANRLSKVPLTIAETSIRRVFLQKAAEIHSRGRSLRKAFLLSVGVLLLLGAVPFTCVWLFGQLLATWILGDQWLVAGRYLEIMAPWLFLIWSTAPCNSIFVVLRKQKFWLALSTIITTLRLGVFGLAYAITAGPEWTLQAFVLAGVVGNLLTLFATLALVTRQSALDVGTASEVEIPTDAD